MFTKRNILLIIFLLLIMGSVSYVSYNHVKNSSTVRNERLIKSVIEYEKSKNEWRKFAYIEYDYEYKYPIEKRLYEYEEKEPIITKFKYTFKDSIPTKRREFDESGIKKLEVKYKKGNIIEEKTIQADQSGSYEKIYQYANNDKYFTLVFHKGVNKDTSGNNYPNYYAEEVDAVSTTVEKGLLKKTINTGLYSNWDDGQDDEWLRFNGTYTVNYDNDGIINNTSVKNRVGYSGKEYKYEHVYVDGRIEETTRYKYNPSTESWEEDRKYDFEYTNEKIDADRYASMINANIMEEGNTYYIYMWY